MSNSDVKPAPTRNERPMSHASIFRHKAAKKDKFPALTLDADAKVETFSYVLKAPEQHRPMMRAELADVFKKTFGQPGKLKSPSTVIRAVGRFGIDWKSCWTPSRSSTLRSEASPRRSS
ncbi:hypothetical protein FQV39_20165 [Bosea sp. F3-2]|uniref:hypothetical protein n=1 Tax=Bosea sp. F3-2 TaxID=2599640 RepID=UPI0011F07DCF|nr:hypothetical protein [Bosea sp. F3-2]QEL24641.1 hypothetical protein FQV39_20165 [Bosea sp. F3-2]